MPRIFNLFSIAVHAIVIGALVIAELLAVGPLPTPPHRLAYEDVPTVRMADIRLPPRRRAAPGPPTISPKAAPSEPPRGIIAETEPQSTVPGAISIGELVGIDGGAGPVESIGVLDTVTHLPSQVPPLASQRPIPLHSGVRPPRKIVDALPVYPSIARSARVEGVVILEAVIDASGNVESVRVLRSISLLDQAAVDAVHRWKFTPALLNGEKVAVVMTVTVQFYLN